MSDQDNNDGLTDDERRLINGVAIDQMADGVQSVLTRFATDSKISICSVFGAVAAQLLDEMMNADHAECAAALAIAAYREALIRQGKKSDQPPDANELVAQAFKNFSKPTEH